MDLVSAMQDFFYAQAFANFIFAEHSIFHFGSLCNFSIQVHDEAPLRRACAPRSIHAVLLQ
jgi:hypothetical protein